MLRHDLRSRATTRSLSYITPNLCADGHDAPCVDGRPGGLDVGEHVHATWVPRILNSPAFKANGVLIITADESDGPQSDASSCCNEQPGPNSPMPGIAGMGGGRIGALIISRWTKPDTLSTTPYNHYSLLASIEDIFRRPYIGFARQQGLYRFGLDVYSNYPTPDAPVRAPAGQRPSRMTSARRAARSLVNTSSSSIGTPSGSASGMRQFG